MKLSEKAKKYLHIIGLTDDASIILTRGFAKQASELVRTGLAVYIPIARGGCHVALTEQGVNLAKQMEEKENGKPSV